VKSSWLSTGCEHGYLLIIWQLFPLIAQLLIRLRQPHVTKVLQTATHVKMFNHKKNGEQRRQQLIKNKTKEP
jgi:hypothetical protein